MHSPAKGSSPAGRRREERAWDTRRRIIDAGLRLFTERGYVLTTVQAVARSAGVAPATIYQAFGTKQAILAAILDLAVSGPDTPLTDMDGEWLDVADREQDPRRRVRLFVQAGCKVAARTAALTAVIREAAATDESARGLIGRYHERSHRTQDQLVRRLIGDRPLRAGLEHDYAVDTFFAVVSSATYDLLVVQRQWSEAEWQDWAVAMIDHEFFGERAGQPR